MNLKFPRIDLYKYSYSHPPCRSNTKQSNLNKSISIILTNDICNGQEYILNFTAYKNKESKSSGLFYVSTSNTTECTLFNLEMILLKY